MAQIDSPAGGLSGMTEIQVDLGGVDRFAGAVEAELDGNLTPMTGRLRTLYQPGANFGLFHQSPDVQAAREKQGVCLRAATEQLESYVAASEILIEAARTVAARYRGADSQAAVNSDAVKAALDGAVSRAGALVAAQDPANFRTPRNMQ